jgi:predicted nucleic acid-binding protein
VKLLDSTVAIDYLRGREPAVSLLESIAESDEWLGASELVRFEVLAGARDEEIGRIERFFAALSWIAVDETISRLAGLLSRRFRGSHSGVEPPDYLIAATALALDAELLTTNVRHFPMIEGLRPAY